VLVSEANRLTMAACQGRSFAAITTAIDRADCMNDVFGGQPSSFGDYRLPGRQAPDLADDFPALGKDRGAPGAMDGTIHSATAKQRRIGGIHDGVGGFFGDVGGTVEFDGPAGFEDETHNVIADKKAV